MTREEKIKWLQEVGDKELLDQFRTTERNAADPFRYMDILGISVEEILENARLVREEIQRRMTAGRENDSRVWAE